MDRASSRMLAPVLGLMAILTVLAFPGAARAACTLSPSTTGPVTFTFSSGQTLQTLCPLESHLAVGLYSGGTGANPGTDVSQPPMQGQSRPVPVTYVGSRASYTITPLGSGGSWSYAIRVAGIPSTGSDTITLWYAGGCTTDPGGCPAGSRTDTPLTINVVLQATPTVTLAVSPPSNANTPKYGQPVTLTATMSGGVNPNGSVVFFDGTANLATASIVNGVAVAQTSTLTPGQHRLFAAYAGDAANAPATSTIVSYIVNLGAVTGRVTASPPTVAAFTPTTLTATFRPEISGLPALTGDVLFRVDGAELDHLPIDSSGGASLVYAPRVGGIHNVEAVYRPAGVYAGATSATGLLVTRINQLITTGLTPSLTVAPIGASVKAQGSAPGGPVVVSIDPTAAANCALQSDGATVKLLAAGNCLIDFDQGGDATYFPAPQAHESIAVEKLAQTLAFTNAPPTTAVVGGPGDSVPVLASSGLTPILSVDPSAASVCSVSGFLVTYQHAGQCALLADQPGNDTYAPAATAGESFTVGKGAQTLAFTSPGGAGLVGRTYSPAANSSIGLPVALSIDPTSAGVCILNPQNVVTFIGAGSCVIDANQGGNADYQPAAQVQQTIAVSYASGPIVTAVAPAQGPLAGGTTVVISGQEFFGATAVSFGGVPATAFTVGGLTQITATVPPGLAAGVVDVRVTTPAGVSDITTADHYAYLSPDATLSGLSLSAGTLSPAFAPGTSGYTASVAYAVATETVTFSTTAPGAAVTVNGVATPVGAPSAPIPLAVGPNSIAVVVTAADGVGKQTYTVVVTRAIEPPTAGAVSLTVPYDAPATPVPLVLSGGTATSVAIVQPPAHGQAVAAGVAVTYTPAVGYSGADSFTYTALNSGGASAATPVTVQVSAPTLTLTPSKLVAAMAGAAYSQTVTAAGGAAPYAYTVAKGALPAGLVLDPVTGVISGVPTARGDFLITIQAQDSSTGAGPFTITQDYGLSVAAARIAITPTTLAHGDQGQPYPAVSFQASGGVAPYAGWTVSAGALPAGMSLSAAGVLSGTPLQSGSFDFTVQVSDSTVGAASVGVQPVTLAVTAAPPPVAKPKAATTPANAPVSIALTQGDTGLISSVTIATPPAHGAVTLVGTTATYTPALNYFGVDRFTYTDSGIGGASVPAMVTVTVTPLPVPTVTPQSATVLAGKPVNIDVTKGATGAPFTGAAIITAPAIGAATVSGTTLTYTAPANAAGTATIGFVVSNPFGTSSPGVATVTVNPRPFTPGPITIQVAADTTGQAEVTKGAAGGPFTAADIVTVTPATAGVARMVITAGSAGVNASYAVRFTPAAHFVGTAVVNYTLSNAFATSDPGIVNFVVASRGDPTHDPDVTGLVAAQTETALRFAEVQMDNIEQRLESLHQSHNAGRNGVSLQIGDARRRDGPDDTPWRRFEDRALHAVMAQEAVWAGAGQGSGPNAAPHAGPDAGSPATSGRDAATTASRASRPAGDAAAGANPETDRWAFWSGGAVDFGLHHERGGESRLRFATSGLTLGGDYRLSDAAIVGLALGYGQDLTRVGRNGTQDKATSYAAAIYGSYHPKPTTFIDGAFGTMALRYDSRRWYAPTSEFEHGKRTGQEVFGWVKAAWRIKAASGVIEPYGKLSGVSGALDGFTETGGVGALAFYRQPLSSFKTTLGLHADYFAALSRSLLLQPRLRIEYQHEFDRIGDFRLQYADWLDGPSFTGTSDQPGRDHLMLGVGADIRTESLTLTLDYKSDVIAGGETTHQVMAKAAWRFR